MFVLWDLVLFWGTENLLKYLIHSWCRKASCFLNASNVLYFSCQLRGVTWDLLGLLDVAGKCDIGPVGELLTSESGRGVCLGCLDSFQMAFHACVWYMTWALIVLWFIGIPNLWRLEKCVWWPDITSNKYLKAE